MDPKIAGISRTEEVLTRLGKHELVQKARLYNKVADNYYYWYDVQPGDFTFVIVPAPCVEFQRDRIDGEAHTKYTDDLVYAEGFEVYVLNT